jgi:hypothetical protein
MCALWNTSLFQYNYSLVSSDRAVSVPPPAPPLTYTPIAYAVKGSRATLHCTRGHRVGSHSPLAPRALNLTCNASSSSIPSASLVTAGGEAAARPDALNCGFESPPPCMPVTCVYVFVCECVCV